MNKPTSPQDPLTYAGAGVDIDSKYAAVRSAGEAIRATATPGVMGGIGSFGGLFDPRAAGLRDPILVSSADGVGTKLKVATAIGQHDTIGQDLVNHCVNDILVQGATPLFFMDYVGIGRMEPAVVSAVIAGCARACEQNGCALLGGETAEMPGIYSEGDYDLVGFITGAVEREKLMRGERIQAGDRLIALPSSGLHTNGYTLARKIFFERLALAPTDAVPELGMNAAEALLQIHRSYLAAVRPLLSDDALHGMAHITGGALPDNLPRVLPAHLGARVERSRWNPPALFQLLLDAGKVPTDDAWRTFNMGVGFVLIVAPGESDRICAALREGGEEPFEIGVIGVSESPFEFVS